jgi:hypothetical protein
MGAIGTIAVAFAVIVVALAVAGKYLGIGQASAMYSRIRGA